MRHKLLLSLLLLASATAIRAQHFTTSPCNDGQNGDSGGGSWFGGHENACELRSTVLPANGNVKVTGSNGSIDVVGEDRRDIELEARITASASSHDAAESLLHQVEVVTNGDIHAEGPHNTGLWHSGSWSVSYKLRVPHRIAAELSTSNGGISVAQVEGGVDAGTVNGGLHMVNIGGSVQAHTVNGGISIALGGDRWHGDGLTAKTVNGPISVKTPSVFSAHLVAQTVNGGIAVGFPITVSESKRHSIDTNIGSGGPTLNLQTVNGGIAVDRGNGDDGRSQREQ